MDLQDQLKHLFPDHQPSPEDDNQKKEKSTFWVQDQPILCKYEKRKGKPITILEGYQGTNADLKKLAKEIKILLGVGGTHKNEQIIIQGDYRDKIMNFLQENGFKTKRVGG
ncbi:translation initiation factor [Muriicola sp.]|uniref:translation initiation factor n=1 Tax=Muriicola sp. TaxID=2020856 RepID=UPI003C77E20B